MNQTTTKKSFIEKLQFYLSFYFNEEERTSILSDYEEWFENEALQGKSEQEICAALHSPKGTAQHLYSESGRIPSRIPVLLQNSLIQIFSLILLNVLINILLSEICGRNSYSYFCFACSMIFIDFIAGMFLVKKHSSPKLTFDRGNFFKGNLSVFVFSMGIILSELFLLPKMKAPNSGELCFFLFSAMILILVLINVSLVMKYIMQTQRLTYVMTLHLLGTLTLLFYIINQLHILYQDSSEALRSMLSGSFTIYTETIILCFIFAHCKKIKEYW